MNWKVYEVCYFLAWLLNLALLVMDRETLTVFLLFTILFTILSYQNRRGEERRTERIERDKKERPWLYRCRFCHFPEDDCRCELKGDA